MEMRQENIEEFKKLLQPFLATNLIDGEKYYIMFGLTGHEAMFNLFSDLKQIDAIVSLKHEVVEILMQGFSKKMIFASQLREIYVIETLKKAIQGVGGVNV